MDDAVDDIVRQFKGVSDGLMRKVVGSTSPNNEDPSTSASWNLSWNTDEIDKRYPRQNMAETVFSSDNEEGERNVDTGHEMDRESTRAHEWHSDNELSTKGYPPLVISHAEESGKLDQDRKHNLVIEARVGKDVPVTNFTIIPSNLEDPVSVPPEVCVCHLSMNFFPFFYITFVDWDTLSCSPY